MALAQRWAPPLLRPLPLLRLLLLRLPLLLLPC